MPDPKPKVNLASTASPPEVWGDRPGLPQQEVWGGTPASVQERPTEIWAAPGYVPHPEVWRNTPEENARVQERDEVWSNTPRDPPADVWGHPALQPEVWQAQHEARQLQPPPIPIPPPPPPPVKAKTKPQEGA